MSRHLEPDNENPFIEIGRLISEESYKRERKEIHLENMIIDLLKTEGEEVIIGEVKKSSRYEKAARMQLAYYLLRLKRVGILAKGQLLFPKEKKKLNVELTPEIEDELRAAEDNIKELISMGKPPLPKKLIYCKSCGYQEFCWA